MCFNFNSPSLSLYHSLDVCVWIICHDKIWECELIMARNFLSFQRSADTQKPLPIAAQLKLSLFPCGTPDEKSVTNAQLLRWQLRRL